MKTTTIAAIGVVFLVLLGFVVAPAMAANADNDLYTSKYAAVKNDLPTKGMLIGTIRAHQNALSTEIVLYNNATGQYLVAPILADGTFEFTNLDPGQVTLFLADGNGGQPEYATAMIVAGQTSQLEKEILGHAITPASIPADVIEVLRAQYGAIEQRERTVVDSEAWTETIQHPAVTHQEYIIDVPAQPAHGHPVFDYYPGHVHAKKVGSNSPHDFVYDGHKYQITGSKHDDAFIVHAGTPEQGHYITVVDQPAWTETIEHPAETHIEVYNVGSYVDVSAEVQAAMDAGERIIVFDNAKTPGGLFDNEGNLLAAINDPAPGIVKKVTINFKLNGVSKTIDANEYDEITI